MELGANAMTTGQDFSPNENRFAGTEVLFQGG